MIVADASVLIAHLDETDALHDRATALLFAVADQPLAASAITMAEVLVGPARSGQLARAVAALDQLDVKVLPLPEDAPTRLAVLRADIGLKLPDCCVLLAGEQARAAIATFDDRLRTAARALGLDVVEG